MANIHQRKLNDLDEAARHYRMAAEVPNAPYFAGRVYGELLRRNGRNREAYDWLTDLYLTLPDDDPSALKVIVLNRIRELEQTLKIREDERFEEEGGVRLEGVVCRLVTGGLRLFRPLRLPKATLRRRSGFRRLLPVICSAHRPIVRDRAGGLL